MSKSRKQITDSMGKRVLIEKLHCKRCKYNWWPEMDAKTDKPKCPKTCPHCKSPYWDKAIERPTVSQARKK
jgi:predicted Zn-ribbon and HTH transcriptional regulator